MPSFDFAVESEISRSFRVRQLEALFDVPAQERCRLEFKGELPLETFGDWNVGLIVGPSGAGKTQIATRLFGKPKELIWEKPSIIEDFSADLDTQSIANICQAVGFNTIPAWMRPYRVLSNGEQFRVSLARHLAEDASPIVVDEFTSVVDRQIAKIGSHAVQKYARKNGKQFIAVTCHYDVLDWLRPDWVLELPSVTFTDRRSLRCERPKLNGEIVRVNYAAWQLFAPYHYLTAELNRSAKCFALYVDGRITSFAGVLHRPHATAKNIVGLSRLVTLPDWQGLGLAMILSDTLASAYKAIDKRWHTYPAHPALVRSFMHSKNYVQIKKSGVYSPRRGKTSSVGSFGGRPCAVFEYSGSALDRSQAERLLA